MNSKQARHEGVDGVIASGLGILGSLGPEIG